MKRKGQRFVLGVLVFSVFTVFFLARAESQPNLAFYKPAGWSHEVVISTAEGVYTDSPVVHTTDHLYLNYAFANENDVDTGVKFYAYLFVDGKVAEKWVVDQPVKKGEGWFVEDFPLKPLKAGPRTLKIVLDSTETIDETNEGDNEYEKTITVLGPVVEKPDFSGGWEEIAWSCKANKGTWKCKIKGTFKIENGGPGDGGSASVDFYLSDDGNFGPEDTWLKRVSTGKIKTGAHKEKTLSKTLTLGSTPVGKYVIAVIDEEKLVAETDETNNEIPMALP
jgi:hypothetical protein